ncbi:NAD-dependent epimerase/dehydratase family protein [Streptacidiphilus albus]|uniref:NAD-dependent epimerase/dehydratase family protein n=1 Tax=Streptacidiphilus albus TaxID=105425 RepID=UPI00054C00A6|nr:NAD(P)-dependent oxidoreductase [Streptacidiphilus albus]
MRIFIAGATGAIGSVLVPLLLDAGHTVTGSTRTEQGLAELAARGANGVRLDVFDRDAVAAAVAADAPDAVIHQLTALGAGNPADNARIRIEGTRNLVDAAKRAGVRTMIAQSIAWAYEPGQGPAGEATPLDTGAPQPRQTTLGGITALEGAVSEIDRHVILRFGAFYGPGTWYAPGSLMADRLTGGTLPANDAVSSFVHVRDAAQATVQALDWPSGPVNIADDHPAPAHTWVPALAAALDRPAPPRTRGGAAWERGALNTRARSLGWTPQHSTWRTGFADQR